MGKFMDKFKKSVKSGRNGVERMHKEGKFDNNNLDNRKFKRDRDEFDDDYDFGDHYNNNNNFDDEFKVQQAQKPESFHHFILDNKFHHLERSVRGIKDVWDKEEQKWISKRKDVHCFTDEEAEDILRMVESHLGTDIKLSFIKRDTFGLHMDALYEEVAHFFESISEYRYGRYGDTDVQYNMKLQNQKIFLEVWANIQANYSRAIEGRENSLTHESVKGQESLQGGDREEFNNRSYT